MKANEKFSTDLGRSAAYKLLAECYYPPGEDTPRNVSRLALCLRPLDSSAAAAAERMTAAWAAEGFHETAIDHARLFIGPFALLAPPYGSVYLEGERRLMGDSTLAASECYHEAGLEVTAVLNGTPDHIAVELEFMHFLIIKEVEALATGELNDGLHLRRKQRAFLERHLAAWVPDFSSSVEEQAQTGFYRNLAASTRMFIKSEFESASLKDSQGKRP